MDGLLDFLAFHCDFLFFFVCPPRNIEYPNIFLTKENSLKYKIGSKNNNSIQWKLENYIYENVSIKKEKWATLTLKKILKQNKRAVYLSSFLSQMGLKQRGAKQEISGAANLDYFSLSPFLFPSDHANFH